LREATFYLVNLSNPAKTDKTAYYARTEDKSGSNSPPFQGNVQIPPPRALCAVKCPRYAVAGGMLKLQFDQYISWNKRYMCTLFEI